MRSSPSLGLALGLALVLALGCAAPRDAIVLESPAAHRGFPARAEDPELVAEAVFYTDSSRIFGADLIGSGCLPIAVRLGARARAAPVVLGTHPAPTLVLADGTALAALAPDELGLADPAARARIAALALTPGSLADAARESFLFFRFEPPVRIRGRHALARGGDTWRELELGDSLLALAVESDAGERAVRVGVRAQEWHGPDAMPARP